MIVGRVHIRGELMQRVLEDGKIMEPRIGTGIVRPLEANCQRIRNITEVYNPHPIRHADEADIYRLLITGLPT